MKHIFAVLMLIVVLASCKKADAPIHKEDVIVHIKDTLNGDSFKGVMFQHETLTKVSASHFGSFGPYLVKNTEVDGKRAIVTLKRNDKFYSNDSAFHRALVTNPLYLFFFFADLESYRIILPFKGRNKYVVVNRDEAEEFYNLKFSDIHSYYKPDSNDVNTWGRDFTWKKHFLKVHNMPEKNQQFLDKFLLSD
ncbi:MAG TPA: hypothetical protein VEC36_11530 [Patescibacteria group bacterium]|nr:hypothetical protein [Patescibacteria group bacterium]